MNKDEYLNTIRGTEIDKLASDMLIAMREMPDETAADFLLIATMLFVTAHAGGHALEQGDLIAVVKETMKMQEVVDLLKNDFNFDVRDGFSPIGSDKQND